MNKEKQLFKRLRYTQGERDAAIGLSPKYADKHYIRGYSRRYEVAQKVTARTELF